MEINTLSQDAIWLVRSWTANSTAELESRELEEPGMPCTVGRQHAYSGSMHISSRSNLIPWAFLGLAKAWRGGWARAARA